MDVTYSQRSTARRIAPHGPWLKSEGPLEERPAAEEEGPRGAEASAPARRRRAAPLVHPVGHEDGVHELAAGTAVVRLSVALALEAEVVVQLDRSLVVREDVELDLADARVSGPFDCRFEQRPPDAPATPTGRDHQAQVGDMRRRRMVVAGQREPGDDLAAVGFRHEHRRMRIAPDRLQVAPLIPD